MADTSTMFDLTGKRAVVTGAGSGLGRAFAQALAEAGADIVVIDQHADRAEETGAQIQGAGATCRVAVLDVRDSAAIVQLVEEITSDGESIDILVNSAGIAVKGIRTHELSEADWNEVIQVNLTGSFLCCRAVIPVMLANGGGSIINIASISGLIGHYPGFPMLTSAYGASKAGINGMTLQMAVEYGADNIRANAIAPGWHGGTNLAERFKGGMSNAEVARFEDSVVSGTPMGRRGTPQDLQGLVVYLASDASSYLTGQIIAHDGGWTAQ